MRRVTALVVVLVAMSAAFPLVATAGHGGIHGDSPTSVRCSSSELGREAPRGASRLPHGGEVSLLLVEREGLSGCLVRIAGLSIRRSTSARAMKAAARLFSASVACARCTASSDMSVCLGLPLSREQLCRDRSP